jgi:hypothetical protein
MFDLRGRIGSRIFMCPEAANHTYSEDILGTVMKGLKSKGSTCISTLSLCSKEASQIFSGAYTRIDNIELKSKCTTWKTDSSLCIQQQ